MKQILDSLRLRLKIILLLLIGALVFLFFMKGAIAFEFGVAPANLSFEGNVGEMLCKNIYIESSEKSLFVTLEDKWSHNTSRDIDDYVINKEVSPIGLSYEGSFYVDKRYSLPICASLQNAGAYYGVLILESNDKKAALGVWINVFVNDTEEVSEKEQEEGSILTGAAVGAGRRTGVLILLIFMNVVLVVVLLVLLHLSNKKIKKRKN